MSEVTVRLDDRVRTWTAALTLTEWPRLEQEIAPHAVHAQAKTTRQWLVEAEVDPDPLFTLMNKQFTAGKTPAEVGTAVLNEYTAELDKLKTDADLPGLWAKEASVWAETETDLTEIFTDTPLISFLEKLCDCTIERPVVITPTLTHPMLEGLVVATDEALHVVLPPPKAWGESPPWPFRDGIEWTLDNTIRHLVAYLLRDELADVDPDQVKLLQYAAVVCFFNRALGPSEGMSFLVQAKRQQGLPDLPAAVDRLQDFLDGETDADSAVTAVVE